MTKHNTTITPSQEPLLFDPLDSLESHVVAIESLQLTSPRQFVNLKATIPSVNHTILLQKLKAVGISGNLLSWMGSYLSNRNQFVQVNEVKSHTSLIKFGVPQGSILGPKLFSLL